MGYLKYTVGLGLLIGLIGCGPPPPYSRSWEVDTYVAPTRAVTTTYYRPWVVNYTDPDIYYGSYYIPNYTHYKYHDYHVEHSHHPYIDKHYEYMYYGW